ncbi:MAG: hypothetical protein HQK51_19475, partial [Oligoflexia bacterium]|nr:hypothetical protein [Oligoflexia bacterium]
SWLNEVIVNIKKDLIRKGGIKKLKKDIAPIEGQMKELIDQLLIDKELYSRYLLKLSDNRQYAKSIKTENGKSINENMLILARESKFKIINLFKLYKDLLSKIPFLLTYNFPVNHQVLRKDYDFVKYKKDFQSIKQKNKLQ